MALQRHPVEMILSSSLDTLGMTRGLKVGSLQERSAVTLTRVHLPPAAGRGRPPLPCPKLFGDGAHRSAGRSRKTRLDSMTMSQCNC